VMNESVAVNTERWPPPRRKLRALRLCYSPRRAEKLSVSGGQKIIFVNMNGNISLNTYINEHEFSYLIYVKVAIANGHHRLRTL
jgi:hypothetical protein